MRRAADFERAVRHGAHCRRDSVVVHLATTAADVQPAAVVADQGLAVVGFVVSKAVGNAVVRNRVKRRLRAVVSHRVDQLPHGGRLVVRALPSSAGRDSVLLARDFDAAFAGARRALDRGR